jgi:hypothetical protein
VANPVAGFRIRAHAMLCFMALIVYRVMRQRLKLANSDLSRSTCYAPASCIQIEGSVVTQSA